MEDRTHIEWDKDDLDALGILKVDVLGLGMLTCIRKAFELVEALRTLDAGEQSWRRLADHPGGRSRRLPHALPRRFDRRVPGREPRADVDAAAAEAEEFYDLVIEVAIVRPGPIQGDMVHPYLRRRQGLETVSYPSKTNCEAVLAQDAGRAAVSGAGDEDRHRRRRLHAGRGRQAAPRHGDLQAHRHHRHVPRKMIKGMIANGYPRDFAERCFSQIEGFGEYGFPESHAASFALLVYASAWLKCRYPDAFAAALLNAQPMGFYAPAQIVRDVREHGVEVRPIDVNHSDWDSALEQGPRAAERLHKLHGEMANDIRATHAVRLGMREIKGFSEDDAKMIVERRISSPTHSVRDVWLRTGLSPRVLERLADADAFGSLGLTRRQALWAVKALGRVGDKDDDLPLFALHLPACGGGGSEA